MPDKQDLEPLLNVRQNQLAAINSQGDGIDNKSLAILATDVALLIYALGIDGSVWQILLALLPIVCAIIFAGIALQPKQYIGTSIDLDDHPEYLAMDRGTLLLQLLSDTQEAINHNTTVNSRHWRTTVVSAGATILGATGLFVLL